MSKLQDALVIRGNTVKNRIVMEPIFTFSFHGDDGHFYGKQHIEHYEARARGGAGLIILQATQCFGATDGTGQWTDYDKEILKAIAQKCHNYGVSVMMQLACGDSDINALTTGEVLSMQREMVSAAVTAFKLGFDGAEFHFAHGYTLCKFIDAAYNKRTDEFGNSAWNRTRILTGILPELRSKTGDRFMLGVRMGEFLPESRDGFEIAKLFEETGVDLINVSFGMKFPDGDVPEGFICGPMAYSGCRMKQAVDSIPVIAAGGLRTEEQVRFLIEHDYVDLAGIGTAFLADPAFGNAVLGSTPFTKCRGCERCLWFTDHTLCPARKK
ncbi:2,4-dienoyl-CoA reductase [Sporobacter termitidis DSM 10068]|uniref:2,4-dienoyl-CoA reductase n=1 Tax=Sporobacter termitidis DSM 10068 TaxID=1123282 RepID=A0A1M5YLR7_9FIRM|nr:NADH-dependent flavin oxidoreductase [Sporobacter termitidis]SHI12838.1 2,4-dienoyl-CoA reductase [Sporobacter termitidis DSM 10068]